MRFLLSFVSASKARPDGVLAPDAGLREAIVPGPPEKPGDDAAHHAHGVPARMGRARLLKRVFDLDFEHYPQCGGDLKIIAAIEEPAVIVRILTHLGLPARAPPIHRPGADIGRSTSASVGGALALMSYHGPLLAEKTTTHSLQPAQIERR